MTQPIDAISATEGKDDDDDDEVDMMITPPSKSEIFNALRVLQSSCLYHDEGEGMRKNINSFEKLYEMTLLRKKHQSCITDIFQ